MRIEWNKVTWYSKLVAVLLGIAILCAGFYIGTLYQTYVYTTKGITQSK